MPPGWTNAQIGELCGLINGKAFKPKDWATNGLPIIRIQNLNNPDASFNYCDFEVEGRFLVDTGELLFAWSGTPGTSFGAHIWSGPKAVLNQHIFRVRFDESKLDKLYFRRAINAKLDELIGKAHGGVGLAHVTKGKFEATEIALPPLAEQRRIVAKLDALTVRLARARAELDRVPVLAARLRRTILNRAVSGEITRDMRDNSANAEGANYPDLDDQERGIWEMNTLPDCWKWADFDDFFNDQTHSKRKLAEKEYDAEGNFPVVDQGQRPVGGYTSREDLVHPATEPVLIFGDHTRCVKLITPPFVQGADGVKVLAAAEGVNIEYARIALLAVDIPAKGYSRHMKFVRKTVWPLPPEDEQVVIVECVQAAIARADRLEAEAARARALLDRLESALRARAFRGELVPQDPNDEPAQTLLARIRQQRAAAPKPKRGRRKKEAI